MPRGKKNIVIKSTPIQAEITNGKVKIDSLLRQIRELCRNHNLQMWNKESLANQIYQDLLFIYHIPKLMKEGVLTLDKERIGDSKIDEVSYNGILSLKEPELINASFRRLWKELQRCEIKDLFYGREFTMFAIEKKNTQRYLALLVDLFKYIGSIELEEYDSNAGYTYFKKDLNKAIAKTFGQFYTPNTVTSSVVKQVEPKVGEKILDPSCGSCSFLAETANYISKTYAVDMKTAFKDLYGIEVESNIYAEGVMNMFINFGILPDMTNNICEKDALIDLVSNNDEFDKIVANPPFGANASTFKEFYYRTTMEAPKGKGKKLVKKTIVNPDVKVTIPFPNVSESAILFFQLIVQKLKKNGVAGVVMSATILNDGFKDMMKWFLETCSLDKVVINPAGTFKEQGTGIETFSFIYRKGKPTTKISVVMLGAEDVVVREITIDQIKEAGWKLQLKEEEKKVEYTGVYDLVKLGDVCNLKGGYAFKSSDFTNNRDDIPIIKITNIANGIVVFEKEANRIPKNKKYEQYIVNKDDIIVVLTGLTKGKIIGKYNLTFESYLNQRLSIFTNFNEKVEPNYIYYYLIQNTNDIINLSTGSCQQNVSPSDILNITISLPPLEIQKQIVSTLDRIFADPQDMKDCLAFTDKAMDLMLKDPTGLLLEDVLGGIRLKRNHLKNVDSIKTQMASVMKSVGMRGYERKKIGNVCDLNPENITKGDKFEKVNYIDLSSVKEGSLNEIQELSFNDRPSRAQRKVKKNDIIWGSTRPLSKSYTFINTDINNLIVSTGFVVMRTKDTNILLPKFLYYSSTTNECIEYLNNKSTGSTFPAFKSDDIAMYEIPIPPLETQQQILTILNEMEGERKSLEQMASKAEERAKFVLDGYLS